MSDPVGKLLHPILPQYQKTKQNETHSLTIFAPPAWAVPLPATDRVFVRALSTVKKIPRFAGTAKPPIEERLKLYGLYKQSMEGDVVGVMDRPTAVGEVDSERQKWYDMIRRDVHLLEKSIKTVRYRRDAWNSQHGLTKSEAKRRYVTLLLETMHRYANSSPEARELVSGLEAAWDQVRSDNNKASDQDPSSSSSSLSSSSSSFQPIAQSPTTSAAAAAAPEPQIPNEADTHQDNAPMRDLAPSSHDDDDEENEEGEDHFDDALEVSYDTINDMRNQALPTLASPVRGDEVQEQNWRRRVEKAFGKMTTEIAALRERMENSQRSYDYNGSGRRRTTKTVWTWMKWLFGVVLRHLMVDALVLFIVLFWMRRRGVRLEQVRRLLKGNLMN
ncbi:MAG: hypothetical protein M1816_003130 [Peltula sp. TS41687]|nr:MAG: hypothetical protein M1816_003130 [Peltula sp. TS41687]